MPLPLAIVHTEPLDAGYAEHQRKDQQNAGPSDLTTLVSRVSLSADPLALNDEPVDEPYDHSVLVSPNPGFNSPGMNFAGGSAGNDCDCVRHSGMDPESFQDLSQFDMLQIAMRHSDVIRSLGIRVLDRPEAVATRYGPAITASDPFFGPDAALAEFDARLNASLTTQNNDRVFNNATLGGDVQELVQDFAIASSQVSKRTIYGTQISLQSNYRYDANNRAGNRFTSYWENDLELAIRQPLLQGAGKAFNLIAGPAARPGFNFSNGIWIAQLNTQISQTDFEVALREYLFELHTAYWDLHRHYALLRGIERARSVSYEIWQQALARRNAGIPGGEAYKEAQTRATYYQYLREGQVLLGGGDGRAGLYNAERTLRRLMGLPTTAPRCLRPIDPLAASPFRFDVDDLVSRATQNRAEVRRQETVVQQRHLELIAAKNFLLPQMDLIGRSRTRGFGDQLTGGGPRFASAAEDFFSFDHHEWEFGVEMGVVVGRRQAKAAVRNATLQWQRDRAVLKEQQRAVQFEVENAIAEVSSSFLAQQSSLARVDAARHRLDSSQALYIADKIQLEFLIDATEALLRAESQLINDQIRYTLALVRVSRSAGSLLKESSVCLAASNSVSTTDSLR
ncbi:MAG: TolC family protein [Planctomycetota bacterium]